MKKTAVLTGILVFLWYPLSCGIMDGLDAKVFERLQLQYLLMLLILTLAGGIYLTRCAPREWMKIHPFMVFNLGMVLLSGMLLGHSMHYLLALGGLAGVFLFTVTVTCILSFERFLAWLSYSAVFFVFAAWLYNGIDMADNWEFLRGRFVMDSFFLAKNSYGRFLLISLLIIAVKSVYIRMGALEAAAMITAFAGLYVSDSRTAMALAAFLLLVLPLYYRRRIYFSLAVYGFVAAVVVLIVAGVTTDAVDFYNVGSDSDGLVAFGVHIPLSGRATIWEVLLHNLDSLQRWLFGFGYRVYFDTLAQTHLSRIGLGPTFIPHDPHNGYVDIVVNFGLVGFLFYGVLTGRYIFLLFVAKKRDALWMFSALFITLWLISNLTESYFVKTTNIFVFLFWSNLLYLERRHHAGNMPGKEIHA